MFSFEEFQETENILQNRYRHQVVDNSVGLIYVEVVNAWYQESTSIMVLKNLHMGIKFAILVNTLMFC